MHAPSWVLNEILFTEQGSYLDCTGRVCQVSLLVISLSQERERWGRLAPHSESACIEQSPQDVPFSNAYTFSAASVDSKKWLVHLHWSSECLLPHSCSISLIRKFLRFAYQGVSHEYLTIPYRLSLAQRVFSKIVEVALTQLCYAGIRILSYIDNHLLCSPSREQAERDSKTVVDHLSNLGFKINLGKSCFIPS